MLLEQCTMRGVRGQEASVMWVAISMMRCMGVASIQWVRVIESNLVRTKAPWGSQDFLSLWNWFECLLTIIIVYISFYCFGCLVNRLTGQLINYISD